MRAPAFWAERTASLPARLLGPLGWIYGTAAGWRLRGAGESAALPVVCVGNFTVGGAGKTPTALALARVLRERGETPAFLARGYGGCLAGPVRVDPAAHRPADVGDEPLLLARATPTVVSRDRPAGARACAAAGASVIVMDDGLQNPSLRKDCAVAVVDATAGIGNGFCLPAGPLRAPLAAQWPLVDAVVLVGAGAAGEAVAAEAARRGKAVFRARLDPDPGAAERISGRRVLAFAGIGRPEKFFETVERCGAEVVERRPFADHHAYTASELHSLAGDAERNNLLPVTTEKDWVRVAACDAALARRIRVLPVTLAFEDEAPVRALLAAALPRKASRP